MGGLTSTKAVLLDEKGDILLQKPTSSPMATPFKTRSTCLKTCGRAGGETKRQAGSPGRRHGRVMQDILKDWLKADVALVETVATHESALKFTKIRHADR